MFSKVSLFAFLLVAGICYGGEPQVVHLTGNPRVDFFGTRALDSNDYPNPDSVQAVQFISDNRSEKSPWIAGLLSLAVPGAGQWYNDSKLKAAAFFGIEVASWVTAHIYDKKGDHQTDVFQDFANQHYSASRYGRWTIDHLSQLNSSLPPTPTADDYRSLVFRNGDSTGGPPFNNINWVQLNAMEIDVADGQNGYTHQMPFWNDQQYYELIGKYDQFSRGWDDSDPADPPDKIYPIQSTSKEQVVYAAMRAQANSYYDVAATAVGIAVINHVVSALEAFWGATRYNNSLHAEVNMHFTSTPVGLVPFPEAKVQYSF